jgi:hypothetical protein
MSLDRAIVTLELERYQLLADWRKLCGIRKPNEMQEIARQGIEEDIASVEEALKVLKETASGGLPRESDTGGS